MTSWVTTRLRHDFQLVPQPAETAQFKTGVADEHLGLHADGDAVQVVGDPRHHGAFAVEQGVLGHDGPQPSRHFAAPL